MLEIYDYTLEEIFELGNNRATWVDEFIKPQTLFFSSGGDYQNAYKLASDNYAKYAYMAVIERIVECVVLLTKTNYDDIIPYDAQPTILNYPQLYNLVRSWNRWLVPKLSRLVAMQYVFYGDVATPSQSNFLKALGMTEDDLTATLERRQRFNDSPENVSDPDSDTWLTTYTNDQTTAIDPSKMTKLDYLKTLKSVFGDYLDTLEREFLVAFGYSPRLEVR